MLVVGVRVFPWLLKRVEDTGSRELFTLAVIALALGVAFGSAKLFGVSFALGAFFAGMVINESDLSHRAATDTQPLQDAFAGLFFVAVGMLFDPEILFEQPLKLLAVLAIIVVGKSLAALGIVLALRYPLGTALSVSAALAQIGEFSFILAGPRREPRPLAAGRTQPDPGRRDPVHHAQPAAVQCRVAVEGSPTGVARLQRGAGSSVSSSARISAPFHSRAPIAMPATSPPGFTRNVAGRLVTRQALDVARSGSSRIGNVSR